MTLVDANVLMYATGARHPFKQRSLAFLELVAEGKIEAATDAGSSKRSCIVTEL